MTDYNDNDNIELDGDDFAEDLDYLEPCDSDWDAWACQWDDDPSPYDGTYSEM